MEQLISTQDAAKFLGITRPTVIKYIQEEKLQGMRVGKAYKISRAALLNYARQVGMSEPRLSGLDELLARRDKKTRGLNPEEKLGLRLTAESYPLKQELDVRYFLAVRPEGTATQLILRVKTPKFFIGRHSLASLSLQDPYVSSLHATLIYENERVQVMDQSTNGTGVKDRLLKAGESQVMGDGDQFKVGTTVLTLIAAGRVDLFLGSDISSDQYNKNQTHEVGQ